MTHDDGSRDTGSPSTIQRRRTRPRLRPDAGVAAERARLRGGSPHPLAVRAAQDAPAGIGKEVLVGTSPDAERKNRLSLRLTKRLTQDAQRVRILGASAIDLAWTAEGRLDACILLGNKPWDTSAGVLIAREAGARVLDHDDSEHSRQSHSTIAVTPGLETDLMAAVQAALAE
jgi:fructose-1,6-bisphosphatase/inositol monophosphatase family enzyme